MHRVSKIQKVNNYVHSNLKPFMEKVLGAKAFSQTTCSCPFHKSKDGDMSYNKRTGLWRCFGRCNTIFGDSLETATILLNGYSKPEWENLEPKEQNEKRKKVLKALLKWIGDRKIDPVKFEKEKKVFVPTNIYEEKMPGIAVLFKEKYCPDKSSKEAVDYFMKSFKVCESWKRFKKETMRKFKIFEPTKIAPRFLQNFYLYLIYDEVGNLVSFQGRRIEDKVQRKKIKIPKMYNLPGFEKSNYIYGLNFMKKNKDDKFSKIIVHEGPGDVLRAYEHGHKAVSLLGRTISEKQIELLKQHLYENGEVVLFLDGDKPGKEASIEIGKELKKHIKKVSVASPEGDFDAGSSSKKEYEDTLNSRIDVDVFADNYEFLKLLNDE